MHKFLRAFILLVFTSFMWTVTTAATAQKSTPSELAKASGLENVEVSQNKCLQSAESFYLVTEKGIVLVQHFKENDCEYLKVGNYIYQDVEVNEMLDILKMLDKKIVDKRKPPDKKEFKKKHLRKARDGLRRF